MRRGKEERRRGGRKEVSEGGERRAYMRVSVEIVFTAIWQPIPRKKFSKHR